MSVRKSVSRTIARRWYLLTGRKPWTFGYGVYRNGYIKNILDAAAFDPARLPPGYGFRLDERSVEYPWMFSRLTEDEAFMLDAGSILNHDFLLRHHRLRNKKLFISTLAPEPVSHHDRGISYVYEDLRHSSFRDGMFDVVVSLSTVEHIGLDNAMLYSADDAHRENRPDTYLDAIREFARVLRPGGTLFFSVPFGRHVNHGWFQVFDAVMVDRVIAAFAPTSQRETIFRYLPNGWTTGNRADVADATYFDIHAGKGYEPDFAAASRAVVCLELIR